MVIEFHKMHGLGNDFVIIDAISQAVVLNSDQIRFIANRRLGVGCDQVLLVEPARYPQADFRYRIFNADGGEVGQCGNGARCLARFVRLTGLTDKNELNVETISGIIGLRLEAGEHVTVDMGQPRFEPREIPMLARERADVYHIGVEGQELSIGAVSMGNPHAVLIVDDVARAPVESLGGLIEGHASFPQGVNVGFMELVDSGHIRLRVFERGVGETTACGSGACAAVAVGRQQCLLNQQVVVDLPGGSLDIKWRGDNTSVFMTGPATNVYKGRIEL